MLASSAAAAAAGSAATAAASPAEARPAAAAAAWRRGSAVIPNRPSACVAAAGDPRLHPQLPSRWRNTHVSPYGSLPCRPVLLVAASPALPAPCSQRCQRLAAPVRCVMAAGEVNGSSSSISSSMEGSDGMGAEGLVGVVMENRMGGDGQEEAASAQPTSKPPAGTRPVSMTVHGVVTDEDVEWLQQQVQQLQGVKGAWMQGRKEGGLRGGAAMLQVDVDNDIALPALVDAVHAMEDRLVALPFKTHSWKWRGHVINYAVAGCGKPIILVHGFGGSAGHFRNLIAQLADDHRVYAIDLLGFGDSDKPSDVDYGIDLWADIINDFSLEFTDEPPVLVGNSIGSLTALTAAAKASASDSNPPVKGLVLLNVAGAMNRKGLMQDDVRLVALSPIFVAIEYLLKRPSVASFLFNKFRSKANVYRILKEQVYRNKSIVDDRLVDILYTPSEDAGAVDVFVKVFTGEPGPRPEALVQDLDVPMLVLWGDADPWTPITGKVAQIFRRLEAERDNVRVVPLPDVGHCPHDDRPELAAQHILPWLDSLHGREGKRARGSLDSSRL